VHYVPARAFKETVDPRYVEARRSLTIVREYEYQT
jgi:hypothetical protein